MASASEDAARVEKFLADTYPGREADGLRKLVGAAVANDEHGMQLALALVAMRLRDRGTIDKKTSDEVLKLLEATPA